MSTFILQSLFLIAVAYLLGALIGCLIRKMFPQSASMLHRTSKEHVTEQPALATAAVGVPATAAATRYAGEEGEASIEIKRPENRSPKVKSDVQADIPKEQPVVVAPIKVPSKRETITVVEPEVATEKVGTPVVVEPASEVEPEPEIVPVPKPQIDDLTRIKGVGLPVALELKRIGITRFEQVARWSDDDVADISEKLGFSGRIERENWMAQAQILATGDELEFTTHQLVEAEQNTPSNDIGKLISEANSAGKAKTLSDGDQDDLKRIVGIGTNIETLLIKIGVTRLSQIAAWSPDEVTAISRKLDIEGRIERENWVQQARNMDTEDA